MYLFDEYVTHFTLLKTCMPIALAGKLYETCLNKLRQIVGEDAMLTQSDISETYTHDWALDEIGQAQL